MNKPDPNISPCFYCSPEEGRNLHCHATCERWAKARELREINKKKKHDFDKEHVFFMTEAQEKITKKNQIKYNERGLRRK